MSAEKSVEFEAPQCSYWMLMRHLASSKACEDPQAALSPKEDAVARFLASFFKTAYADLREDLANVAWAKAMTEADADLDEDASAPPAGG